MHDGMQARVLVGGVQSESFSVQMDVQQGCVLAPVLFNIFLLSVAQLSYNALGPDAAYTKTLRAQVIELQYADDCAILTHNRESMQRALDVISGIYSSLGLQINTQKTKIFVQPIALPINHHNSTLMEILSKS
ncbi:LINE-1 reverse transcriptase-like 2 [Homarus americanus]|uniref:LINE-1 reverse transcriptase-like 2 n=1 Tax=Homarus americanus TaxID=6706 RepID=A0A8J5NDS0_HOMAM|nr:LINE-1 reverse transcriptase-like 2 [Homarus americanus]